MKIVFACLLCLLLGASESFAVKGGPTYPAGTNIVGTYAGVMQGAFDPTNPASSNSIGIFTLGVPSSGNASGAFVMFSRGRVFTGTARAFADPQKASLKGIVSATYNYTLHVPLTDAAGATTISDISVTASANGPLNAKIAASKSASSISSSTTVLRGEATLNISEGGVRNNGDPLITSILSLVVSGVKQSNTASGTISTGTSG
jgi:hypothetical protein